ncbi:syntaxin 8 [Brevipalpus obovatus]|uniref:syntaxin 8 n=1 Tax=Brevipalpus obovatus TaxID=246614 RepID=UPI003D9F3E2B
MNKKSSMDQPSNMYSTNSWMDDNEPSETVIHDYDQVKQRLIREQDAGLDTLGEIISRQKAMAHGICTEIDLHNEILDDIGDAMDANNDRLVRNSRNIAVISRKDGSCCYWLIIFLLFIAIVVLSTI